MFRSLSRWFDAKPFAQQLLLLAVVLDPVGFVAGYLLLAPALGVEPLLGGVYGLVAASVPMSFLVMRQAQ